MSKKKPVEEIVENIRPLVLDIIMGERYAVYAKDVIQDRAIPDARDGLKPVQRRIVYFMEKTGNTIDKPTRKCAHIVGGVMGQYHPHGDSSIYDALVRLSQTWSVREPLVDFQGNNGSIDDDPPAAFRYTEARLSKLSEELVRDLEKDTVDMQLTFDDMNKEPVVLPAHFPNLLVNGAEGIAVGMATHIPPHNLREVISAVTYRLKHPECEIESLLRFVKGPDFPTGGIINSSKGIEELYRTGHAHLPLVSRAHVEKMPNGNEQIVITEIPYGTVKKQMVYAIDKLRADKAVPGIDEVRDETDRNGLRIAIDLKSGAKAQSILAYLYSKPCGKGGISSSYSANMVAIVEGRPKTMDLLSYCDTYITFRIDTEKRRVRFDLAKNEARQNVVDGLIKALSILDELIKTIRASKDKADAKNNICKEYGFNEEQAESIVTMPLYKLTHTDIAILEKEHEDLVSEHLLLTELLTDEQKMRDFISEDLRRIAKTYGSDRRTTIAGEEENLSTPTLNERDLIQKEDVYIALSRDGYLKRSSIKSWKGSGGDKGALPGLKEGDSLVYYGLAKTTDWLLAFTSLGNYVYVPVNELKEGKWLDEGAHINAVATVAPEEKIVKAFVFSSFPDSVYMVLLSKKALIKRVQLSLFPVSRRNRAVSAIRMSLEDRLVDVALTYGDSTLVVFSVDGQAEAYSENQIPLTNPKTGGVKAGMFKAKDMAALLAYRPGEKTKALLATDLGATRIIEATKIPVSVRLAKSTLVYPSFKGEPHELKQAMWLGDCQPPLTLKAMLANKKTTDILVEDFYLTPADKYIKKPEKFVKKYPVENYFATLGKSYDDSLIGVPLPAKEEPKPGEPPAILEERKSEEGISNFEQISLFDE